MSKEFKTYAEQIQHLLSKGLIINNEHYALECLKETSYFALINGYKSIFKQQDGNYKSDTTFEDVYSLYTFDEELRELTLKYILKIERRLKSYISYYFCQSYPNCQHDYLNVNNFRYNEEKIRNQILKLIIVLQSTLDSNNYPYINHYKNHHQNNVPLWVLINALSFGKISRFYSFLKIGIQQKISNEYPCLSNSELERMLDILSLFRNVCAHNERLYSYKTRQQLKDNQVLISLSVQKKGTNYIKGVQDFFSIVICFKYLLKDKEFSNYFDELNSIIDNIVFNGKDITKQTILDNMGFPENWKDIKDIEI